MKQSVYTVTQLFVIVKNSVVVTCMDNVNSDNRKIAWPLDNARPNQRELNWQQASIYSWTSLVASVTQNKSPVHAKKKKTKKKED